MEHVEVKHNPQDGRFEVQLGDELAVVEYRLAVNDMIFTHTEVPPAYEGQGIANQLAKFALDYAVAEGHRIGPVCPFIKSYVQRHKEYQPHTWD